MARGTVVGALATDRTVAVAVSLIGVAVLWVGLTWGLAGAKGMVWALRVLSGDVPYRDFWTLYAPGHIYAIAAILHLFEDGELVLRMAGTLMGGAVGGVFYLLARQLGASRSAAVSTAMVVVVMRWHFGLAFGSYTPAILCLLAALCLVARYFHSGEPALLYWAGIAAGVGACFKHDVAGYVGIGVVATLFIARAAVTPRLPAHWLRPPAAAGLWAAGCATVLVPVAWLLARKAGADAWRDLIVFPPTVFITAHREPYPGVVPDLDLIAAWSRDWTNLRLAQAAGEHLGRWLICNLSQVALAGGLVWILARRSRTSTITVARVILLVICGTLFWLAAHVRQQTHVYSMAICTLLLLASAGSRPIRHGAARFRRRGLALFAAIYIAALLIRPAMLAGFMLMHAPDSRRVDVPGGPDVSIPATMYATYLPIVDLVRTHVLPGERIYVGCTRHDVVDVRMPGSTYAVYLLTGRLNGCRYDELHPGVTDQAAIQREMVCDLDTRNVRCLILWKPREEDSDTPGALPPLSPIGGGARVLDRFIREEFEPIMEKELYVVMWRKGKAPVRESVSGGAVLRSPVTRPAERTM